MTLAVKVALVLFKHIYFTLIEKQVLTTYTNLSRFCFLGTTPVLAPYVWANENPQVDTRSRVSNSGPQDCEADAVPYDHGHHKVALTHYRTTNFRLFQTERVCRRQFQL